MQFNPGETEEIEKKERERRKQSYEISWKKKRKKKKSGEMRIEWKAAREKTGGGKWGMKRRSNGRV